MRETVGSPVMAGSGIALNPQKRATRGTVATSVVKGNIGVKAERRPTRETVGTSIQVSVGNISRSEKNRAVRETVGITSQLGSISRIDPKKSPPGIR